ncbi:MAG: hypothetical protein GF344_00685 [Chitinivibrionales bacterium]|nr:hypothetical protein [Chitinivibrionales bacterium]MBD3355637.1 hypothetical protein [Chitinivibrionales bacterium]
MNQFNRIRSASLFSIGHIACAMLIVGTCTAVGEARISSDRPELVKADSLREAKNYDAALTSYVTAYTRGWPKDSLFYYWAKIYVERGVHDSALALNRSALDMQRSELHIPLLRQRYIIYRLSGAKEQARKTRKRIDAAVSSTAPIRHSTQFFVDTRASTGYDAGKEETPSLFSDSVSREWTDDFYSTLSFSTGFRFRGSKAVPNKLGAFLKLKDRRRIDGETDHRAVDSLVLTGGLTSMWDDIAGPLSLGMECGVQRNRYQEVRWTGSATLSASGGGGSLLGAAGYSCALTTDGALDYQLGYATGILLKSLTARITLSPSITAMAYGGTNTEAEGFKARVLYIDENAPGSDEVPLFYTDQDLTQPLDTSLPNGWYGVQAKQGAQEYSTRLFVPVGFVRLGASIAASIRLSESLRLKPSCAVAGDWYPKQIQWDKMGLAVDTPYVAFQPQTKTYYSANTLKNNDVGGDLNLTGPIGYARSEKRMDAQVVLGCGLEKRFRKAGMLDLHTRWRLYATSLSASAPVTKTLHDLFVNLTWRYEWISN